MSHDIASQTFAVAPREIPADFSSAEDLRIFVAGISGGRYEEQRGIRHPDEARHVSLFLYGSSRSGWFQDAIARSSRARGMTALAFLTQERYDKRFGDSYHGYESIAILVRDEIGNAISAITEMFQWTREQPLSILEEMAGYEQMPDWSGD